MTWHTNPLNIRANRNKHPNHSLVGATYYQGVENEITLVNFTHDEPCKGPLMAFSFSNLALKKHEDSL
jgi:hypothetical protein